MSQPERLPAWNADYHQMTRREYDQLLQQRRWQLDADHAAGYLADPEHAYLRDHVATVSPLALREQVDVWTPHTARSLTGQADTHRRQHIEDQVLAAAEQLDPADDSVEARQLRETAASIHDHRTSPTTDAGPAADTTTAAQASGWPAESLDQVVDTMREALDGRSQMPPFRPADQASDAERRLGWVSAATTAEQTSRTRQATDLAVAALQVRDGLDRITPPPPPASHAHDQTSHHAAEPADVQAATDDH